tara:strand:+ start:1067 stop:1729 length:663 start_codon:yes stop_codon:yes gene_type:complete
MLEILYEDNHLIAVNKKSGEIVQGDKTGDYTLSEHVKNYIKKKYKKKGNVFLGTIHRLDRPTSGVIIYAKTSKALKRMNDLFQKREINKIYWAIVENIPNEINGKIESYLRKNQKKNKSFLVSKEKGKYAYLEYNLLQKLNKYYLLEIKPTTGRHHQIRTQLAQIGSIIKGDLKYGAKRSNKDGSISLLAKEMKFTHPIKKENIVIKAPLPTKDSIWKDI